MRYYYSNELYHHGVKGQKWGRRRYQYEDGRLTEEGKGRYSRGTGRRAGGYSTRGKLDWDNPYGDGSYERFNTKAERDRYVSRTKRAQKIKKALKVGAGVAGAAALGYGAYKYSKTPQGRYLLDRRRRSNSFSERRAAIRDYNMRDEFRRRRAR